MKRRFALMFALLFGWLCAFSAYAAGESESVSTSAFTEEIDARSAILMDADSGKILYEKNADTALPPASVTKVMTMLLVMEAIDDGRIRLDDTVTVSEKAASMGGSQVFLKVGEQMSVEDLLKSVVIASANDAAVALAEYVAGSEKAFVTQMNTRAKELGMQNTTFENTNGLDDTTTAHLISARDIAIMSRELITKHPKILEYSSIWMDSIRNGAFTLTNTNRLVRFYEGANGLKTGSTSRAKFCISASAKRNGMQLICVIMGAPTRDTRNQIAKELFDYGFATYAKKTFPAATLDPIAVTKSLQTTCPVQYGEISFTLEKSQIPNIKTVVEVQESLAAPIALGQKVGSVKYLLGNEVLGEVDIVASQSVDAVRFSTLFLQMLRRFFLHKTNF